MTIHAATYECHPKSPAAANAFPVHNVSGIQFSGTLTNIGAPAGTLMTDQLINYGLVHPMAWSSGPIPVKSMQAWLQDGGSNLFFLAYDASQPGAWMSIAAAGNAIVEPGGNVLNTFLAADISEGRQAPRFRILVDSTVHANADTISGSFDLSHWQQGYTSRMGYIDFEDSSIIPAPSATEGSIYTAQQFLRWLSAGDGGVDLGVDYSGQNVLVKSARLAKIAPTGRIWVSPSDIGTATGQIPNSVGSNTSENFSFHPSVFFRGNVFASIERKAWDPSDIAVEQAGSQPFKVTVVSTTPEYSGWLLFHEGATRVVRISHGSLDLRRPRDIWNTLIVPRVNGKNASPIDSWLVGDPFADNVVSQARLGALYGAECLYIEGTPLTQDDTQVAAPA